jgi:Family of unknown function (DUF6459)
MPPPPQALPGEPRSRAPGTARRRVLPLVPGFGRPPARRRPLPDAAAVRLVAVPDPAPPYDDERPVTGSPAAGSPAAGSTVPRRPRRLTLATAPRAVAPVPRLGAAAVPARRSPGGEGQADPRRPARPPMPGQPAIAGRPALTPARRGQAAAAEWPSQFAQVLAETLAGSRPQGQIVPWTTDQARRRIRQLGPMLAAGVQPRVRRIVTSRPTAGVVEMTVIVGFGPRIRALAVRLERDGPHGASPGRAAKAARWVCTAIEAA